MLKMTKFILAMLTLCPAMMVGGGVVFAKDSILDFSNRNITIALPIGQHKNLPALEYYSRSFDDPTEPPYKTIKFLKQDPPRYINERVERLMHGITVDIPPEYDYYGYEIRRYMKSILTPSELTDSIKLGDSIADAKRARIILDYWQRQLNREMAAIRETFEAENVNSRVRANFRYHESKISSFIPEMYGWIDRNIEFMEFLQENRGQYFISYPLYMIPDYQVREEFMRRYEIREEARKRIVKYSPFRTMIY